MKRPFVLVGLTILVGIAVLGVSLVMVAYSGAVNVAASADYLPGARWFFDTVATHSIAAHAADASERGELLLPANVTDEQLRTGAEEYRAMCRPCHGTPGGARGELGKGMKPHPPDLADSAQEMPIAELAWVIHHGIRHTGMPAFGSTHLPEDLAAVAAFVERFDEMTPEEYQRWEGDAAAAHTH